MFEPVITVFLIVFPVPAPSLFKLEVFLTIMQQIVTWHHATGKEMVGYPIFCSTENIWVGCRVMAKDVGQEFACRLELGGYTLQQKLVIAHVLKHFNRYHAIIVTQFRWLEDPHILSDDVDVELTLRWFDAVSEKVKQP